MDVYRARYAETAGAPQLARLQDVDFGVYLVDDLLVKTDRASMAHSLEARVPFLDPLVTNLAFALPTRLKVRGLAKKVLLRKAVEPLVPAEVVHGRKRGFSIPAAAWLRGELEPFARETLSPENLQRQGFFQAQPVTRLIDEHVAGREDWSRQLWGLLAFTLWYERHVEQEPPRLESARMEALARVKVWIDITAPAHVLVFRPLVEIMRGRGDEVEITARDYAQTLELLELHGLEADEVDRAARRPVAGAEGAADDAPARRAAEVGEAAATSTSRSRTARTS